MSKKRSAEQANLQDRHGDAPLLGNDAPVGAVLGTRSSSSSNGSAMSWDTALAQLGDATACPAQYDAFALLVHRTPGSQTELGGWKSAAATESSGGVGGHSVG
jgi:hypothetical protein